MTWRFTLREGVTFHNGNPFNADDVLYSFERQTQDSPRMSFALASVKEIRKVDDHTIELVTQGPDPTLLLNMPFFYIVDQEYMEENNAFEVVQGAGKTNFANTNANGTGPFKVVEWVQDNRGARAQRELVEPEQPTTSTRRSSRRSPMTRPGSRRCSRARST